MLIRVPAPLLVFAGAFAFYFLMAYNIADKTYGVANNFDCIFSLDSGGRAGMTLTPARKDDYVTAFHPFFAPVSKLGYALFAPFSKNRFMGLALFQCFSAAISVMFFMLILARLRLRKEAIAGTTLLYALSFSTLLFAVYYDGAVYVGASMTAATYLILRWGRHFTRPFPSAGLFLLCVSGLITGAIQYMALLLTQGNSPMARFGAFKLLVFSFFCLLATLLVLSASGFFPADFLRGFNSKYPIHYIMTGSYAVGQGRMPPPENIPGYALWVAKNMITPSVYSETFMGVFLMPVVTMPILFKEYAFWSHSCTWFTLSYANIQTLLAVGVFAFALAGMAVCVRSRNVFYHAIAWAMLGYTLFFGFFYTPLVSYLYSPQFLYAYLILAAIGFSRILDWVEWKTPRLMPFVKALACALLLAIILNNLDQWNRLTAFTMEKFPIPPQLRMR